MRSFYDLARRRMAKKGQVIELVSGTVLGILGLVLVIFVVLFALSALNPASFFTSGSASANATTNLQNNVTFGVGQFGQYIPTVMLVLGVVFVLAGLLILVLYIRRMQMGGSSAGGL